MPTSTILSDENLSLARSILGLWIPGTRDLASKRALVFRQNQQHTSRYNLDVVIVVVVVAVIVVVVVVAVIVVVVVGVVVGDRPETKNISNFQKTYIFSFALFQK